jgi:7-cyano-7-deazaguanine synthase
MKGVVLHSGGLDSTTLLAIAREECDQVESMTLVYGQRHMKEIEAAESICTLWGIPHTVRDLTGAFSGSSSTLIDPLAVNPQMSYSELREVEGPSPTYVPFRNALFLSHATAFAQIKDAQYVYFAAHADDAHNWAYPDTTPEFIGAMGNAIYIGTYHQIRLRTPLMWMTKAEIITQGADRSVPFELTYSCYEGSENHCGTCPTCVNRIEAFRKAGVTDPTKYD